MPPAGTVALTWDAENRMITSEKSGITTTYLYDGRNPITEYTGTTLEKVYTRGMDLSGSMQGAGGVGGLLSVEKVSNLLNTPATSYPIYDENENISEYLQGSGGQFCKGNIPNVGEDWKVHEVCLVDEEE